jgi:TPR repeat protein
MCYQGDQGVPKNPVEALKYYQLGHNAGDKNASCDYALMLVRGDVGVPKNPGEGARIYRQVAEMGYEPAWLNLGCLYDNERELNDRRRALECFQRAAAAGSIGGKVQLALYLKGGLGGAPVDLPRARQLLKEVADTPIKPGTRDMYIGRARTIIAGMYQGGEGGPVDIQAAFDYYGKASDLGNPKAVVRYAELVVNGPAYLPRDPALTKQYLRTMIEKFRTDPRLADDIRRASDLLARLG